MRAATPCWRPTSTAGDRWTAAGLPATPLVTLAGVNWAFDTGGREFYMPQVAVSAGQTWTFSAVDRVVYGSGMARTVVEWYDSGGRYLSEQAGTTVPVPASTVTGGTWTPVSVTAVAPANARSAHVLQIGDFGTATGTNFKATQCDYQLGSTAPASDQAAIRYNWGPLVSTQSDEYNGTAVDLTKWGLFGADAEQTTGCSPGYNGHGQRCASQTTVAGGYLSASGTADGKTGGLYSRMRPFKYGRMEVRERAVPLTNNGGRAWHAVPLLWPENDADWQNAEIDFAERDVASPSVSLFVHHNGGQTPCSKSIDSTEFHNYAVDWQQDSVTWYIDSNQVCTVNASINYFSSSNGGAQMDMFPATGALMRPARQDVDWIRMYPNVSTVWR
jgi:glycosyl hydrolase family 16